MTPEPLSDYHVNEYGSIEYRDGSLLYPAESLEGLTPEIRRRLAELHSANDDLDWEGARERLIAEGLIYREESE